MHRITILLIVAGLCLATLSCSQMSTPTTPETTETVVTLMQSIETAPQTHLWGYFNVYIDIETQTAKAVVDRQAMFTGNVVNLLENNSSTNLSFHINNVLEDLDYIDVDVDISITHPFPGMPQYNGYDVRGVFMGNGSGTLSYNSDLHYPVLGTDQIMLTDSTDGYTRWFNKSEFSTGGMPLFSYTQGKLATPDFSGDATLNAYKYFADGLGETDNLWNWLNDHADQRGIFSSGATNTRNYNLRFPNTEGIEFGYAVLANWEGLEPKYHPSNTPEAVTCNVTDNSTLYYVDVTDNGGDIILDISLFGWNRQPSVILIESTVLSVPYEFTVVEMNPIDGNENYSTYHVEIVADNVTSVDDNEFWVIAQYDAYDYTNEFGVVNLADIDPLAAFYRYDITVGNQQPTRWAKTWGGTGNDGGYDVTVDSSGNTYITGYFQDTVDFDPGAGTDEHTSNGGYDVFLSKFNSAGSFQWAKTWGGTTDSDIGNGVTVDNSGNAYVTGNFGGTVDFDPGTGTDEHTSNGSADISLSKFNSAGSFQWAKTWGGTTDDIGYGITVDNSGNVYVTGYFQLTVDFDPGTGIDEHTPNGGWDIYLSKFNSAGSFQWAKTWGGIGMDNGNDVTVDSSGNAYITGYFYSTVDFDPGAGTDEHTSNGGQDAFLSKFNSAGSFQWAKTWGGTTDDIGYGITVDNSGNVYVTGYFQLTVDFDPGTGIDEHTPNGGWDIYLSKFNSAGSFQWAKTWGGIGMDNGNDVIVDSSGNAYITGYFEGTVDFDSGAGTDEHTSNGSADIFLSKFSSE